MKKYNGEEILDKIIDHLGKANLSPETKESLMKDVILPAIKDIAKNKLIERSSEAQEIHSLERHILTNNVLCRRAFVEFVKNYNK